jgi:hypothetical protein
MARLASSEGGWFKLWGKKWLTDEKLNKLGLIGQGAYLRLLCLSNVLMSNGIFVDRLGNTHTIEYICYSAKITPEMFRELIDRGFVSKEPGEDGPYFLTNWDKHQTKAVKSFKRPERPERPESPQVSLVFGPPKPPVPDDINKVV